MFDNRQQVFENVQQGFLKKQLLVVGDLILDSYLWGEVNRVSPEAPVPIVRFVRQNENVGGAANVALNLVSLGFVVHIAGFLGTDNEGVRLLTLLNQAGINTEAVVSLADRPTITKTRIFGGHQQMLRLDKEEVEIVSTQATIALRKNILEKLSNGLDAVILSDYAKGVLGDEICNTVIEVCRRRNIPVFIDPKGQDYTKYASATLISPNRQELAAVTRQPINNLDILLIAGEQLRASLNIKFLVTTLSEKGIVLLGENIHLRIPAMAQEVFDVSGAGDTVIATLAAGQTVGLTWNDTLHLANLAAGIVVGHIGTAPITKTELLNTLTTEEAIRQSAKVCSLDTLLKRVAVWRSKKERIVFTNGCFDLLHVGHVAYMEQARRQGHRLIIGLNTDRSVRTLKGPSRPVIHEEDRARVLAALTSVDAIVLFDEETPLQLVRAIKPDVLAKGADYTEDEVVGGNDVKSWGGEVVLIPLIEGHSSTNIMSVIKTGLDF